MTPCRYCRAPRVDGIRTCGRDCLRGIDPRLADYLGVMPWVIGATQPWVEEPPASQPSTALLLPFERIR